MKNFLIKLSMSENFGKRLDAFFWITSISIVFLLCISKAQRIWFLPAGILFFAIIEVQEILKTIKKRMAYVNNTSLVYILLSEYDIVYWPFFIIYELVCIPLSSVSDLVFILVLIVGIILITIATRKINNYYLHKFIPQR